MLVLAPTFSDAVDQLQQTVRSAFGLYGKPGDCGLLNVAKLYPARQLLVLHQSSVDAVDTLQ